MFNASNICKAIPQKPERKSKKALGTSKIQLKWWCQDVFALLFECRLLQYRKPHLGARAFMAGYKKLKQTVYEDSGNYGLSLKAIKSFLVREKTDGLAVFFRDMLIEEKAIEKDRVHLEQLGKDLTELKQQLEFLNIPIIRNSIVSKVYAKNIRIDARMAFTDDQGLSSLEYSGEGLPYRWSGQGSDTSSFWCAVERTEECFGELKVMKSGLLETEAATKIQIFVDKLQVTTDVRDEGDTIIFIFSVPALEDEHGALISFTFPTWSPKDLVDGSADERLLGVAFVSLEISNEFN